MIIFLYLKKNKSIEKIKTINNIFKRKDKKLNHNNFKYLNMEISILFLLISLNYLI